MDPSENNHEKQQQLRDHGIDLAIMSKGFVNVYYKEAVLAYDLALLEEKTYEQMEFDCMHVSSRDALHCELERKLGFPAYYGKNFDALNDCLREYAVPPNGLAIVFRHLDFLDHRTIALLLDVFADHARRQLVLGKRMLILVQVDNPRFRISEPIGSVNSRLWNDKEWFEGDRVHNSR